MTDDLDRYLLNLLFRSPQLGSQVGQREPFAFPNDTVTNYRLPHQFLFPNQSLTLSQLKRINQSL